MALLRCAAKFDPFLSLDYVPMPSTLAQSKERKGSNFAIWQPCFQEWRHFRQQQKQRELQEEQQQQQMMQVEHAPVPFRNTPSPRLMRTPEPDYDTTSVGSAVSYASSYRSSKEDLRPRQARRP